MAAPNRPASTRQTAPLHDAPSACYRKHRNSNGWRGCMEFNNRIKKEMTEGIVRAILDDAGYRVIDYGIEKTVREVIPLSREEYSRLAMPHVMRNAPDLVVMDRDQTSRWLVEIKYRSWWDGSVLDEVEEQVRQFGELVLVSIHGNPENPQGMPLTPSRFLRCCRLRVREGIYEIEAGRAGWDGGGTEWVTAASVRASTNLWWKMRPIQEIFPLVNENATRKTLTSAIEALGGILNTTD